MGNLMRWSLGIVVSCLFAFGCGDKEPEEVSEPEIASPLLRLPEAYSTEIIMDWADYSGAAAYEVDVALDQIFTDLVVDAARVSESRFLVEGLTPETTYFMRIRAVLFDGFLTGNSNVAEVTTLEIKECNDPADYIFVEKDGLIKVEFEDAVFASGWELKTDNANATGRGYMSWTGPDFFSRPSNDLVTYELRITNPGTYRFLWFSAVTLGESGTEHNDTWLRFPGAENYYGEKGGGERVYPRGTNKSPNPEGASADGWFKIYRSGNDLDFKWQARTSDRDPHEIFVEFAQARRYTMEISARSKAHGIDKFVLFSESVNQSTAIGSADFSEIICL